MTTKEQTKLEQLEMLERVIFTRRDAAENAVDAIAGKELTPLQFLQIRQAIAAYEECEERIGNLHERMNALEEGNK